MRLPVPLSLALRELRHEWLAALCFIAALVGVLAPLLLLLALKNGVIGAMVDRLVEDPANREIIAMGAESYDAAFFARVGAWPETGFVMPATRRINAQASAVRNPATRALDRSVPLVPSAPGDPLIASDLGVTPGKVWLSAELAIAIDASEGSEIEMLIGREVDGTRETARLPLEVLGVLAPDTYGRKAVFLSLPDLLAVEQFRDDLRLGADDLARAETAPERYASFRLYARDLNDLQPLMNRLSAEGIIVRPRVENVALLLGFRNNLNLLYGFVAIIAVAGFWASMVANLRGMVERQRVSLSLLRFLSMSHRSIAQIPLAQSLVLVGIGVVLTLFLALPGLFVLNTAFQAPSGDPVARLSLSDIGWVLALGAVTGASAAIWAMRAAASISSEEVLRNG
jgi:putative ABC transport system permease protein